MKALMSLIVGLIVLTAGCAAAPLAGSLMRNPTPQARPAPPPPPNTMTQGVARMDDEAALNSEIHRREQMARSDIRIREMYDDAERRRRGAYASAEATVHRGSPPPQPARARATITLNEEDPDGCPGLSVECPGTSLTNDCPQCVEDLGAECLPDGRIKGPNGNTFRPLTDDCTRWYREKDGRIVDPKRDPEDAFRVRKE